jgi:hypothetical protein
MRLSTIFMGAALVASLAYGQNPAGEVKTPETPAPATLGPEPLQAEIIHVRTLTGDSFDRLARLLSVFNARIMSDEKLRTIIVYAPKDVVAQMRRVVAELDTPGSEAAIGRNIEMTLAFLRCSAKAQTTAKPLPDDMEAVAKQLRAATQYQDIQLWDVVPLRLQEGKATTETLILPTVDTTSLSSLIGQPTILNISILPDAAARKGQNWSVRFGKMSLDFKVPVVTGAFAASDVKNAPVQYSYQNLGINTAGDFEEGRKTVLGKVSGSENDTAIFVVVSLKVLD